MTSNEPDVAVVDTEKVAGVVDTAPVDEKNDSDGSSEFQLGVQRARAVTSLWDRKTLILMFCLLYLVSFVDMLMTIVLDSLGPYITSSFQKHGLLATISIVSTIFSGCSKLTIAKVVDIWGRVEGFLAMLFLVVVSLVMKATAQNMETFVGAQVIFWTGHIGMMYIVDIVVADITTLRNRMVIFAVNGTPTIASTFAGPRIAELFYTSLNFRWAFGAFTIIMVGVCIPVLVILLLMQRKALKQGLITVERSNRTFLQSAVFYFNEFDVIGIILITAVFALILLPFSIVHYAPKGWASGYIIAMEVIGVLCVPVFYIWEKKYAPVQFLPWKYLSEPTIIGSCILYGAMFASIFTWNTYFGSYLQVVHRLSITTSGYVLNALSLSSAIISPIIGGIVSWTGDFKWTTYTGIPLLLLGTALLIPFRSPSTSIALVSLTQVLCGVGSGIFALTGQLAVMVPVTHQEVAVVVALWGMFGSIGAGIGAAIAGAIWNNVLPGELYRRLPEESKGMSAAIFGDLVTQMSFADGTPEREAVVGAYADVQRKMAIAGACFMPVILASVYIWKDVNIKKLEKEKGTQTKGTVF